MLENMKIALSIMGKGMGGIFTVMLIIMCCVWFLQKVSLGKKKKDSK
ncbi:MAG: hypothetical protein GX220_04695 [Treponema sp.]|nr:hypothetical protein [Treponema sp.]